MQHYPSGPSHVLVVTLALALAACSPESAQSLVEKGNADLANKDARSAAIRFKNALQADPGSIATRVKLGRALVESGDLRGAVIELSRALDQKANPSDVMPSLARALLESGQHKLLLEAHANVKLTDKPAQAAFQSTLAAAWSIVGDRAKSEAAIAAALAAVPDYPDARMLQVRAMLLRGEIDNALSAVNKVLGQDDRLQKAWQLKGEALVAQSTDLQGAEAAFRKALEIDSGYIPAHGSLVIMRIRSGDLVGAKKQLEVLRAAEPNSREAVFLGGQLAFFEKDYVKAREAAQQLLRVAPESTNLLQLAAAVEWVSGSLVIAQKMLETAVRLEPSLEEARINLAQIYIRLGQAPRALVVLKPLLTGATAKAAALAAAGEASLQLGQPALAEGYFSRAASALPDDQRLRTALAMAQLANGDSIAAFAQLESLASQSKDGYVEAALASARLGRKEFDAALAAVDSMIRKNPGNTSAYELRGRVQSAQGDLDGARKSFEKAISIEPRLLVALIALADLDAREGHLDRAKIRYEEFLKSDPGNHLAITALADLRLKAGDPAKEVQASLAQAIKAAPGESVPRLKLIELLSSQRQIKSALVAVQEAAAVLPDDVHVLDALGRMLWADGNSQQALATFRRIIAIDPNLSVAHIRLADVHRADGNRSAAVASLRRAIEIDPRLREARTAIIKLLLDEKRPKEALEFARDLQLKEPKLAAGYLMEGAVHRKLLNHEASAAAYRRGLQLASAAEELPMNLFVSLLAGKNWKQAEAFAVQWLSKYPNDGALAYNLAEGYMMNSDLKSAERYFSKAVALRPDFAPAINNLASMLVQQGKPGAVDLAQRAVRLSSGAPAMLDTLAGALAADGRFAEALQTQQKAVAAAPTDPLIGLNLAKIALQAGDKTLARSELDRLMAMGSRNPHREEVVKLLKAL